MPTGNSCGERRAAQAHLTHHHPLSDATCALLGELVHLACLGRSRNQLRLWAGDWLARFPVFRFDPYPGLATGYVVGTVQTGAKCASRVSR